MRAEIVSIGTELLLGNIVDTNAARIARDLATYGVDAFHQSTVGDNLERCAETIRTALGRAEAVIITGGIGPTPDDCTRAALALALGVPLERREDLCEVIRERYRNYGRQPTEAAFRQADMPLGAAVIVNPTGTAPGILVTPPGQAVYVMPGVPYEMVRMLEESVLPDLRQRFGLDHGIFPRVLRCRGIGESDIATQLDDLLTGCQNPTVATYVKTGEVEVRITARATDAAAAAALSAPLEEIVRKRIGSYIFGVDKEALEVQLAAALLPLGRTLAVAESCTGGRLAARLTAQAGSSAWFRGGVVAYANAVKERVLGVPGALLAQFGAVSAECAAALASGVCEACDADYGVAITGIAGPGGGSAEKPVGLVYVAVYDRTVAAVAGVERRFSGDRGAVQERSVLEALELALRQVAGPKQ
ncbi:MAG: competence/damage-inducible protein A [Fimbriimonadaceae bacterium]|nr:competence/damage-inducible protein A [Fimbriimonadaceae bacterium]